MSPIAQGTLTRANLLEAIAALEDAVLEWENSETGPLMPFGGGFVKTINERIETEAMRLIRLADTRDAEQLAKPIVLAVDRFEDQLTAWAEGMQNRAQQTNPRGSEALWMAYGELLDSREIHKDKQPEPIEWLINHLKVNPRQVALTYGFWEKGEPSVRMVYEELAKPGTHYDRATWQSPAFRRYWAEIEEQWTARAQRSGRFETMVEAAEAIREIKEHKREQTPTPEAPEPLDDLIRQRVPIKQLLMMKPSETEDSIRTRAAELGIHLEDDALSYLNRVNEPKVEEPPPPQYVPRPEAPPTDQQLKAQRDVMDDALQVTAQITDVDTYPELGDMNDRIFAMSKDELKATEIAQYLLNDYPDLTWQKVNAITVKMRNAEEKGRQEGGQEDGQGAKAGQPAGG